MLRAYDREDLAAITAIYAHHVRHGTASFEEVPPTEAEMARRFGLLAEDGMPILVDCDDQGCVLGYAYAGLYNRRSAYRHTVENSIYVDRDHQRRGAGRRLLEGLIRRCKHDGYRQMMAVIGDSGNTASIGLHAALGFRHLGTAYEIGFKFGRWLDVVYMQRDLGVPVD